MLVTQQPVLRRFWYPVTPMSALADGPKPFRLLGEDIVLWLAEGGIPVALADRCCHRTARLSRGYCDRNRLVCGYHGWEFDPTGRVVRVPQSGAEEDRPTRMSVPHFRAEARYGYVWVALDDPLYALPALAEASEPGFRQVDEFYEVWNCAGLRVMENSFDNAHFSFVHRKSFGDQGHPVPSKLDIEQRDDGFVMTTEVPVINPEAQMKLLHMDSNRTVRHMRQQWFMPFVRNLRISYPNGMVHTILTAATPIDDRTSQLVQFAFRNDTEEQAPAKDVIAFDRVVTNEDRYILESTDHDVPLDQIGSELNMASDRPGILMRKMLLELLARHGEAETRLRQPERPERPIRLAAG